MLNYSNHCIDRIQLDISNSISIHQCLRSKIQLKYPMIVIIHGARGSVVVKALRF